MLRIDELETPVPVVDLDRLTRNLDRMATYAATHGLRLRPHIKTHKSTTVAREQMQRGAIGLTCATPREIEVMSAVAPDLLLAYPPVGSGKAARLLSVSDTARLAVSLDSAEAVEVLAAAARAADRPVGVYIELDFGMHRVGVADASRAAELARLVRQRPPLTYAGILFYPGHVREHVREQDAKLDALGTRLSATLAELDRAGVAPPAVSGGSTPTVWRTHELAGITELRPGTYVYNDRTTAEIGACGWDDCALTVLATVVSTAVPGQAVVDAGTKALGREPLRGAADDGFGALADRPEVIVKSMSEEHGMLDLSATDWRPAVGEQVRIVPNHVCTVVHLNDVVYGVRGDRVESSWPVAARGRWAPGANGLGG